MSYYYCYYVGYKYNGKFYPWGPYDAQGNLCPVIEKSSSFASDLHEQFYSVPKEGVTEELRKEFEYEGWNGEKRVDVKYLRVDDLPRGDGVKKGYCLMNQVQAYEEDEGYFEGFYDVLSPEVYAAKLQHEMTFGKNQPKKDDEGYEYTEPNASDYMYYAWYDNSSEEAEARELRNAVEVLVSYAHNLPEGTEFIILETEG